METTEKLIADPYLHLLNGRIYNPIEDRNLFPMDAGYYELRDLILKKRKLKYIAKNLVTLLSEEGWLISEEKLQSKRFYLKYVSLEAHTICNQSCYFCPVSVNPRDSYFMPDDMYESIARQLSEYNQSLEAVYMINYNEPTADKRFIDQIRVLKKYELPVVVNTNATGLTPDRVDKILQMGGLETISVNLSTMDQKRYAKDRAHDHLKVVIRNMDYIKDKEIAKVMDLAVLGKGDDLHKNDYKEISTYFAGSQFNVKYFEIMDRAGYLTVGNKPTERNGNLCGCENLGSRPLQHLHITPYGKCVLCCEDYDETYVVGDLTKQTVSEVLTSPEVEKIRRMIYGLEDSPDNFICNKCVFAVPDRNSIQEPSFLKRALRRMTNINALR